MKQIQQMRRMALLLATVLGNAIPLTLLYEKNDSDGPRYVEIVIREAVQNYNEELAKAGVELRIKEVADYSKYSKMPEYRELAWYAGSNDMNGRMAALQNVQQNVILLIAASDAEEAESLSRVTPCNSRLFIDINLDSKIESVATIALIKWLQRLLGMNIGDPFVQSGANKFSRDLSKMNLRERFARCAMAEYGQDGEADRLYAEGRKRRQRPRHAGPTELDRSSTTAGPSSRWAPRTPAGAPLSGEVSSWVQPRPSANEFLSKDTGSGIKLGAPLTISSNPSDNAPLFSRITSDPGRHLHYNSMAGGDKKVRRFPLLATKPPAE